MRDTSAALVRDHSVRFCGKAVIHGSDVRIGPRTIRGLQSCGSTHICPVCALKIAHGTETVQGRRGDVQQVLDYMDQDGNTLLFATLTSRHNVRQKLSDLIDRKSAAWRRLISSKGWRELQRKYGYPITRPNGKTAYRIDFVRTSEVTYGHHGWHPHDHLTFAIRGARVEAIAFGEELVRLWMRYAAEEGLSPSKASQDRQIGHSQKELANYHAKGWGLAEEHSAGLAKAAKGLTHWDLLALAMDGEKDAQRLFKEFAAATKGKRTIQYSPGLKKAAKLDEKDDKELTEAEVQDKTFAIIGPGLWGMAIKRDGFEIEIRQAAKKAGHKYADKPVPPDWLEPLFEKYNLPFIRKDFSYRVNIYAALDDLTRSPSPYMQLREVLEAR
jgi:hypothetical protein